MVGLCAGRLLAPSGRPRQHPVVHVAFEDAAAYARISALNAIAAVKALIGDLDKVVRVVKVVGFVASTPDFTGQPGVVNGASELLQAALGDQQCRLGILHDERDALDPRWKSERYPNEEERSELAVVRSITAPIVYASSAETRRSMLSCVSVRVYALGS